ncbi:MAG: carboxymuconolactone decarboxylase family protein [Sandaracinobacter sp.]
MRLKSPRIPPLPEAGWTAEQREILAAITMGGAQVYNIFRTQIRLPEATRAFLAWGSYILSRRNDLPPREREIVILRIGYLCRSGYEWAQHECIGLQVGLTEVEIARIKAGPDAAGWSAADKALLQATDELHRDQFITTPTWNALAVHFSESHRINLIYTTGQYTQVSMLLNTLGVQLDDDLSLDPDLAKPEA